LEFSIETQNIYPMENLLSYVDLTFEDGSNLPETKVLPITPNENYFRVNNNVASIVLGSFKFNACSYKNDGKKFRLVIHVYLPSLTTSNQNKNLLCIISPSFVIKAKKPVVRPGLKRKNEEEVKEIKEISPPAKKTSLNETYQEKKETVKEKNDVDKIMEIFHKLDETNRQILFEKMFSNLKDKEKEFIQKKTLIVKHEFPEVKNDRVLENEMDSFFFNLVGDFE
jgi:hypothetical protein